MKRFYVKTLILALTAILAATFMTSCANQQEKPVLLDFLNFTADFTEEYIIMEKSPEEDFIVLNLTDTQLSNSEWNEGTLTRDIIIYTIDELIKKVQPDLITISGDVAWAGETISYRSLADLLDSYKIPWAPVWGNHDNEDGPEFVKALGRMYSEYEYCIYEEGPEELGHGNYIISIYENGTPITGIFMVDSHDHDIYIDENGNEYSGYSSLNEEQKIWYRYRIENMIDLGYKDSAIVLHIPIYAYRTAFVEAFDQSVDSNSITLEQSFDEKYWNEGYKGSYGVRYEYGGFPPVEDGMIDLLEKYGHTTYMLAGHDHVNNFVINYRGVNLVYALKTGMGCYWNQQLNGGTVMRITSEGITELYHEYVNVDHMVNE